MVLASTIAFEWKVPWLHDHFWDTPSSHVDLTRLPSHYALDILVMA